MTNELQTTRDYLIPPPKAFWGWNDDGDVAAWADGSTIAFRDELASLLNGLVPTGLPPIGAALLVIAATRDAWGEQSKEAGLLAQCMQTGRSGLKHLPLIYDVVRDLEKVRGLDKRLRTSMPAKTLLLQTVFENWSQRTSPDSAQMIVGYLSGWLGEVLSTPAAGWNSCGTAAEFLTVDLQCLHTGLKDFEPEAFALRVRTGLDATPGQAEIELPLAVRVRTLLAELKDDAELGGLARLATSLMAAVTVPRPVVDRDELQLGGVSDISNRGPLDRLLLTELAYDDLSLATRVAMNEALYLRRELPPKTPPRRRSLLLDAGIRTWGVPRVFSTAIALAVAATAEKEVHVDTFRTSSGHLEPIDLATRDGLIEHLAALDRAAHPGSALRAFAQAINSDSIAEPMLITVPEVAKDAEFQRRLGEELDCPIYLGTVDRTGHFQLLSKSPQGRKLIKEARLDLGDLLRDQDTTRALVDPNVPAGMPAIFSVRPFPLLLPHNISPQRIWEADTRGVVTLTSDRRVMLWINKQTGARQIGDGVPRGGLWWSAWRPLEGVARAVIGTSPVSGLHLVEVGVDTPDCAVHPLSVDRQVRCICAHRGALFMIGARQIQVFSETTAELVQTLEIPVHTTWQRERFFYHANARCWHVLSFDGRAAHLEKAHDESAGGVPRLLTMFDREGVDGPLGVTSEGNLYSTSSREQHTVPHGLTGQIRVRAISKKGERFALESNKPTDRVRLINTDDCEVGNRGYYPFWLCPEVDEIVQPANIRHRFVKIGVTTGGEVSLVSRKAGLVIRFHLGRIELAEVSKSRNTSGQRGFKRLEGHPDVGYQIQKATWPDGSEAFLDSRGLLHLKSSDVGIPECSIVLTDGQLAGWCSDGQLWGAHYFTGEQEGDNQRVVFEKAILAFVQRVVCTNLN